MSALLKKLMIVLAFLGGGSVVNAKDSETVWLDVRTPEEYKEANMSDSILVDFKSPKFRENVQELDRKKSYKVFCRSGNRADQAIKIMKELGFQHLENVGSLDNARRVRAENK